MAEETPSPGREFSQEDLNILLETNEAKKQFNDLLNQEMTSTQAIQKLIQAGIILRGRNLDYLTKSRDIIETQLRYETDLGTKIQLNNSVREQEIRIAEQMVREQAKLLANERDRTPEAIQRLKTLQDSVAALRRQKETIATVDSSSRQLLKTLTGISKSHEKSLGYATLMSGREGFGQLLTTMRHTLASAEGLSDVFGSALQKVQEATLVAIKSVSSLNAQYAQQTGLVANDTNQLTKNWRALTDQAASLQEVNEARTALATGAARFVHMHEAERNKMIQLGTTLKQVGVDMNDFTQTVNLLQIGFKMSTQEVVAFENRLFELGQNVGFSTLQIQRDWAQSQNILAKYGKQSEGVFAGLEKASKQTGIGIGQLIGITDQFVTFEGAANIVGKFNAMLGGPYLNTIEMVYAKDHERLQLLRAVFKQSGKNWQQMSEHEQMMYAYAAGIKDMRIAAQLWGNTDKEFKKVAAEQQKMADLALKSKDVFEKLQQSMMRLAVAAEPLVNALSRVVDFLAKIMPESTGAATALVVGLGSAYVSLTIYMKAATVAAFQNISSIQSQNAMTNLSILSKGREIAALGADTTATNINTAAKMRNASAGRMMLGGVGRIAAPLALGAGGYYAGKGLAGSGRETRGRKAQHKRESMWGAIGAGAGLGAGIGAGMGAGIFSLPGAAIGAGLGAIGGGIYHMATYQPPQYQGGGHSRGGPIIVGDSRSKNLKGAEMVTSKGASIVNSKQTNEIIGASQINREAMNNLVAAINRLITKLDAARLGGGRAKGGLGLAAGAIAPITLTLDGNTLASSVINLLRDRHEVGIVE